MNLFTRILLTLLAGGISLSLRAQTGVQVSPVRLFFPESVGTAQTAFIRVVNPSAEKIVLQLSCADWKRDSLGSKVYYDPGQLPTTCCRYLRFSPESVELNAGQEAQVLVSFRAPEPADRQLRNAMIFLTQVNEKELAAKSKAQAMLLFKLQLGVHAYFLPSANKHRQVEVTDIRATKNGSVRQIQARIENRGNLPLESFMRLELLNMDTDAEVKLDPVPFNSLPGESFWVTIDLPATVKPGKYLLSAIADSGPDADVKVAELEMKIE
ncbi:fimbrial biogenesis chaperone [Siphonobacter aquaeclarae]|uniref:P pilus assembly protein, chaperone PapD n=1 Tax=Siphonobacter aquaeclarae TaxID=563176 RepID=A0A1G9UMU1_9BACT|nr:molecular chaperone [Siphonobacter aquaeclarae]SDM61260.1 P pilus assembly protein, chaperone PapD [Siphonobacter aquaeclarae]